MALARISAFEWDAGKSRRNEEARGLGFQDATRLFFVDRLEWCDVRQPYGEVRIHSVGMLDRRCYVCIYTLRGDPGQPVVRIISFRRANRRESDAYRAGFPG